LRRGSQQRNQRRLVDKPKIWMPPTNDEIELVPENVIAASNRQMSQPNNERD
jgi:hypothetical protein